MKHIPIANPQMSFKEANAAFKVISKGWISMGKKVQEFELKASKYLRVKNSILMNNGTSAIHAALLANGIQKGDEVIVPSLSYISSANAVLYCGAKPVFCESDPRTFNTNASFIEKKITKRTKAIIVVDLKGMPIDFDEILYAFKKYKIISDSAESFGAEYKNKKVGSQVKTHIFSFFANKNITMGEGGLITTNDDKLANICRIIRNQGQDKRYHHIMIGNNFRPTDYAAAIGIEQMKKIEKVLTQKNKIAKFYERELGNNINIKIPYVPSYVTKHSWYMYCVIINNKISRDKVKYFLEKNGVETRLSFPPIHLQPIYKKIFDYKKGDLPIIEEIYKTFLDIPCWMGMKLNEINTVCKLLNLAVK